MINKTKYLWLSAPLLALSMAAESLVLVRPFPVVRPTPLIARPAPVSLRIEEWCPVNFPNDVEGCLNGVYVKAYPAGIIWGSYGRFRGPEHRMHHRFGHQGHDHGPGAHRDHRRGDGPSAMDQGEGPSGPKDMDQGERGDPRGMDQGEGPAGAKAMDPGRGPGQK